MTPRRRSCGFTLIELLVALAIAAFVMVSLYSSLYIGFKAKKSAEEALMPAQAANAAMDMIRTELESAQPVRELLCAGFTGSSNQDGQGDDLVTFYSSNDAPPHQYGQGEVKQVQILAYQAQGSKDYILVRHVWSNLLADVQADPDEEVLCRHVSLFKMRYFDGTDWYTDWDSTQQGNVIPFAVEVTLDVMPPGAQKGSKPIHYLRVIPLSCATQASTSSSSSTGSTGSTGSTPAAATGGR
jgi:type II secretion system protein J